MAQELSPDQVRARRFGLARKGYDRAEVEAYLSLVADELHRLGREIDDASERSLAVGIDDAEALALELQSIGGEVGSILEAARSAAEGIRSRASSDASAWRSSAEEETSGMVADASEQSQSMRAAAWNEGSSMLSSAAAEASSHIEAAKEAALVIRAEAEREAIRLTSDAKRDRDEIIGSSRAEAEQLLESARIESEGVLEAAKQQADLAQERARALEDRRSELLTELEQAKASIGELESEIESKRQALEEPPEPEPVDESRTHHGDDGGSVRIVAPSRVVKLEPVDAEELAAEVEAMRISSDTGRRAPDTGDSTSDLGQPPDPAAGNAEVGVAPQLPEVRPQPEVVDEAAVAAAEAVTEEIDVVTADAEDGGASRSAQADDGTEATPDTGHRTPDPEAEPEIRAEPEVEAEPEPQDEDNAEDDLASLFASLREPEGSPESGTRSTDAASEPEPEAVQIPDTRHQTPELEEAPSTEPLPDSRTPELPNSEAREVEEPDPDDDADPADALIPIQNEALRAVKRVLVELQNETLEHLRVDTAWEPDEAFTNRFEPAFDELGSKAEVPTTGMGSAFGTDLYDALTSALEASRESGAGERQVAAAASKIFRTWRSDEAERRVMGIG